MKTDTLFRWAQIQCLNRTTDITMNHYDAMAKLTCVNSWTNGGNFIANFYTEGHRHRGSSMTVCWRARAKWRLKLEEGELTKDHKLCKVLWLSDNLFFFERKSRGVSKNLADITCTRSPNSLPTIMTHPAVPPSHQATLRNYRRKPFRSRSQRAAVLAVPNLYSAEVVLLKGIIASGNGECVNDCW